MLKPNRYCTVILQNLNSNGSMIPIAWAAGQSWNSSSFDASSWSVLAISMFSCFLVMIVSMTVSTTSLSSWFASRSGVRHQVKPYPAIWLQVKYRAAGGFVLFKRHCGALHWLQGYYAVQDGVGGCLHGHTISPWLAFVVMGRIYGLCLP